VNTSKPNIHKLILYGGVNVVVIIGVVLGILALSNSFAKAQRTLDLNFGALVFITICSCALLIVSINAWRFSLRGITGRWVSGEGATIHYAFLLIGKYIPGKVWGIGLRALTSERLGLTSTAVLQGSFLEIFLLMQSALLLGLPLYFLADNPVRLSFVIALIVGSCYLQFRVALQLLKWVSGFSSALRLRSAEMIDGIDPGFGFYSLAMASVCLQWILVSSILWLVLASSGSIPDPGFQDVAVIGSVYPIAVILGFAAVFAPGGLGIREGVVIGLLAPLVPLAEAVDAALTMRLWNVAFDVSVGLLGCMLFVLRPHSRA
jgi:hypothetical protein